LLPFVVTDRTNWMIADLVGPLVQDGSGSRACACAGEKASAINTSAAETGAAAFSSVLRILMIDCSVLLPWWLPLPLLCCGSRLDLLLDGV